jgi:hypothetical protein
MASAHHDPRQAEIEAKKAETRHWRRLTLGHYRGQTMKWRRKLFMAKAQEAALTAEQRSS